MKTTPVGKKHRQPLEGWPSVEDLFVFVTVARNGGFARAALELGLSPSYISKRIAILEKCLNARLFFRNNRVMRLTPEGENALGGAMQVVSEMDGFVSRLDNQRGVLAGNITINCSFGFGDAPRDKCAPFREINGIAAAFQYSQKNYNPTASSFL